MRTALCTLLLFGCAPPEAPPPAASVPGADHLRLTAEPGPPPAESPPIRTLWARIGDGWQAVDRVLAVAPGGDWRVDADRRLRRGDGVLATDVLPDLRVAADGSAVVTRSERPPASDIWQVTPAGELTRITQDGRSDRPFPLPDGRLLWVSGQGGVAGFMLDGRRLTNAPGASFVPVPARPAKTRLEGERVIYDAGDGEWWLDLHTGAAGPR